MSSVCPSRIRHPFPAQDTRLWLFPAVPASVNSAGERTRVLHAECKSSQPTNPSISIHTWQRRRKPPHAIMAGNLIFKLEIICPGMGDGHHNHLPSKPQTARDGCREGREAVIILFLFSKPHHSLIFPHISGCQCKGAALFFSPSEEESKTTQSSLEHSSDGCSQMGSQTSQQDAVVHYQQGTTFPCPLMRNTAVLPICLAWSWQNF